MNLRLVSDLSNVAMQPVGEAVRSHTHLRIRQANFRIRCGAFVDLRVGPGADQCQDPDGTPLQGTTTTKYSAASLAGVALSG